MDCSSLMFEYDLVCLRLSAAGRRGALRFFYSRSNNSNGRDGGFCDPSARKSHRSDSGPYGSCGSLRSSLRGGDDSPSNRNTRNPPGSPFWGKKRTKTEPRFFGTSTRPLQQSSQMHRMPAKRSPVQWKSAEKKRPVRWRKF